MLKCFEIGVKTILTPIFPNRLCFENYILKPETKNLQPPQTGPKLLFDLLRSLNFFPLRFLVSKLLLDW